MENRCNFLVIFLKSICFSGFSHRVRRKGILLLFIVAQVIGTSTYAMAQQVTVKGTVKDQKGEPLIGVTVQIKGTTQGAPTDLDGNFALTNVPANASLVFTYIGMQTQTVNINARTQINVRMVGLTTNIDDVVVVGYQVIKRSNSTASISSIQAKDIENTPAPSFEHLLQGKLAGVNIQALSGAPGSKNTFMIRGNTALTTNIGDQATAGLSNPLYVLDGIPTTLEDLAGYDATSTNFLATMNIDDIESIDILKDASAAAIYGSRGANGVVIIKTKKGRIGEPVFTFNAFTGVSNAPDLIPVETGIAERHAKYDLINNYWDRSNFPTGADNTRSWKNNIPLILSDSLNPAFNNNVNYQAMFYRPAKIMNYDFGVSGGTEKTNYRVNFGYYDEDGIVTNTGFKRYSLSVNLGVKLSDRLENQTIIRIGYVDRKTGLGNSSSKWGTFPIDPLNMNSSLLYLSDAERAAFLGQYSNLRNININLNTSVSNDLRFRIAKGLYLNNTIGVGINTTKKDFFTPASLNSDGETFAEYTWTGNKSATIDTYLSYTKEIGKMHAFNALFGNSVNYNQNEYLQTGGRGAASDQVKTVTGLDRNKMWGGSDFSENGMLSYWGRLGYRLKERYMIDLNFRTDGSSRFGKNSRWGYFPAISGGWIFSEESFVKEHLPWLNYGKLRGSWGINGKQFSGDYERFNSYTTGDASYGGAGNRPVTTYNGVKVVIPNFSKISNDDLSWEKSTQWSVGMDLELLNRRLTMTPEVYNRETTNLLFNVNFPIETGYSNSQANVAGVRNYGYELSLTGYLFKPGQDFQWQIDFNVARNYNQVTKLPNGNRDWQSNNRSLTVGLPMNQYFMMQNTGKVYSTNADIPVNPYTGKLMDILYNGTIKVGTYEWVDTNGDHQIIKDINLPGSDARIVEGKDPNPKFIGGLTNTFTYKRWSLRVLSSFVAGRTIFNATLLGRLQNLGQGGYDNWANHSMPVLSGMNYWRKPGDVAEFATMYPGGNYNSMAEQTRWLEDGSYLKINNLTLSYNFDAIKLKTISLKYLRLYAMLDNVAMFQKFTGPDAERVGADGADYGGGYANPKKVTFGINVKF